MSATGDSGKDRRSGGVGPGSYGGSGNAVGLAVEKRALTGARAHFGSDRGAAARRRGSWYVAEHRMLTMRSYFGTVISASIFNPLMYLFALGIGIGSYIDRSSGGNVLYGVSYLTFVGPALLVSAAITAAFEETTFPVMGGFRWTREFFAMHATPLRPYQIANGVLIAAGIRVAFTVSVFWLMLMLFGALPSPRAIIALPVAVLAGLGLGAIMSALAARLTDDDGWFVLINRLVIAPMFLFSGTFYPLEQMPSGLRWIGWISPLWHGTELGRWAAFGLDLSPERIVWHLFYLVLLFGLGLVMMWRNFERRLIE
jgi:lipooligosaccharide transport system permease protein